MRDTPTKADNVGDTLPAANFNAINNELENLITTAGGTLDPNGGPDTNLFMISEAAAAYGSAADYYADSGAVNAYVLGRVASSTLKPLKALYDGMQVKFMVGNTNTGASTVNVTGFGAKSILFGGGALTAGMLTTGEDAHLVYDQASDVFHLFSPTVSFLRNASNLNAGTLPAGRFNDTSHGSRSGGSLHSLVVAGGSAGFMSGSDKTKLDGLLSGTQFTTNANDRTGSRSLGVTYTNTTGRPMLVVVETFATAASGSPIASAYIDGTSIQKSQSYESTSAGDTAQYKGKLVWCVPAGSTYKVQQNGGTGTLTLSYWSEMD